MRFSAPGFMTSLKAWRPHCCQNHPETPGRRTRPEWSYWTCTSVCCCLAACSSVLVKFLLCSDPGLMRLWFLWKTPSSPRWRLRCRSGRYCGSSSMWWVFKSRAGVSPISHRSREGSPSGQSVAGAHVETICWTYSMHVLLLWPWVFSEFSSD